jgi:hypothetical protein
MASAVNMRGEPHVEFKAVAAAVERVVEAAIVFSISAPRCP